MKKILKLINAKGSMFILPFLLNVILVSTVRGQVSHGSELGASIGVSNYSGDLIEKYRPIFFSPAGQIFYKYNFKGDISVLRLNLLYAGLRASESKIDQPLQNLRNNSFDIQVFDASTMYEYNFYNFRDLKGTYFMSPYMFMGLGATIVFGGDSPAYFNLPMGFGLKVMVSRHINVGAEFGARLTFSDLIDGVSEDVSNSSSSKNDWYYFYGLTASYTWYKQRCPQKKKRY